MPQENQDQPTSQPNGGPQTPEGKAVSRYNAQKHAILRENLTEYEEGNVEQIYNDLADDLKPEGRLQESLLEMIAVEFIKMQRIGKAEGEMVKACVHPNDIPLLKLDPNAYFPKISFHVVEKLLLYSRYSTSAQNRVFRILAMFRQLKGYEPIQA